MLSKFLPKDFNFFDLFDKQVNCAVSAARYLSELVAKGAIDESSLSKMHDIEHQGDDVARTIIDQMNKTFITPFDREDIHSLVKELDDVIDMIYTIVSRMKVYKVTRVNPELQEFAAVIEESVRAVSSVVKQMRNTKNHGAIIASCADIHRLENVGDTLRDKALGDLFEKEKNPIEVIKWKEIYQDAETVLDICEDVAHVVGSILCKQA